MSMPYSFASKLIELRHKGKINTSEYEDLVKKLSRYEQEIRNKTIDDAIQTVANEICVGCGYLKGHNCTYKGGNCGVSMPMLETVTKTLEQMKGRCENDSERSD